MARASAPVRYDAKRPNSHARRVTVSSAPLPTAIDSAQVEESAPSSALPGRPGRGAPATGLGPRPPRINRPVGLAVAARPGDVPQPQHAHLPGWVRRAHGQARPILADLIGGLSGAPREQLEAEVGQLVEGISAGRFSLAWQYPRVIEEGWNLLERARLEAQAEARQRRGLESVRRRVADQLRDAGGRLAPETATRLHRTLRSADAVEAIKQVEVQLDQAVTTVRTLEERRRDREIDRTRERLRRSLPRAGGAEPPAESWQDALRRIADQYSE